MRTPAIVAISVAATLVVAAGVTAVVLVAGGGRSAGTDGQSTPRNVQPVAGQWQPVCGFPGPLVDKLVADGPPSDPEPLDLPIGDLQLDGRSFVELLVNDRELVVHLDDDDGVQTFVRYPRSGGASTGSFTVDFDRDRSQPAHSLGSAALADDGSVYLLDTYEGRRDVVHFGGDGARLGQFAVPSLDGSTGHPLDLQGVDWLDAYQGGPALAVNEQSQAAHVFRPDGAALEVAQGTLAQFGDATLTTRADGDAVVATVADPRTGELRAQLRLTGAEPEPGRSTPYQPSNVRSLAPGPDGDGVLVYAPTVGIEWVDAIGVRKGMALDSQFAESLPSWGDLVERGGDYWMPVELDDGRAGIAHFDADRLRAELAAPVTVTAVNEPSLAQLGIGLGPVTDQVDDHFDASSAAPSVAVRFEQGWGELGTATPGDGLELVSRVMGDPTLADPVTADPVVSPVAVGGGDVALPLPETRPGAYEVEVELRARGSDTPLSAACLRYSVGAPGSDLALDALAPGADWGGPAPLRGVQLAERLGVGSFRFQFDFGALVPDPGREPSPDGIDWSALPDAPSSDDPAFSMRSAFAGLRDAAAAADASGVVLILQLGQGGDAELAAVKAGTWQGWAGLIVAAVADQTTAHHWEPWNEPNIDLSGAEYATGVSEPFAQAAHRADPSAVVIGGNSLGFALDWWKDAVGAGLCDAVDVLGVHPYTGWNRSWEEEGFAADGGGFDAFRSTIGDACSKLPIWDTESGWTSDGPASYWAQGADVARKMLWYRADDIAQWTYFFSEGGWGESDLSWSLIQVDDYVKTGGLAFSAVAPLLTGRAPPQREETGIPFSYAMRFGDADPMLAVWTDDLRIDAVVTTDAAALTVVDVYGARRSIPVTDGRADLVLTGSPQFILTEGAAVAVGPVAPFGDDVLAGRPVEASSSQEGTDPSVVTSGTADVDRGWRSGRLAGGGLDPAPNLVVDLGGTERIDRIAVATAAIRCCESGLRDYTISVRAPDGSWQEVAAQQGQFFDRIAMFAFPPTDATAVRIEVPWTEVRGQRVLAVNAAGFAGGLPPPFMGLATESDGMAAVSAVSAWRAAG